VRGFATVASSSGFAQALAENPAPRRLGDVTLRYEPSMLIGETDKPLRSWRPTAAWVAGLCLAVAAVALVALGAATALAALFVALAAAAFLGAFWLERLDARRRCFVVNFGTLSLRLDFLSPIRGQPRTAVVPFDAVRDVQLFEQADGQLCLTVDFVPRPGSTELLREVLVAFIPAAQAEQAARLRRLLHGAFGLGEKPADEAAPPPGPGAPTDAFER